MLNNLRITLDTTLQTVRLSSLTSDHAYHKWQPDLFCYVFREKWVSKAVVETRGDRTEVIRRKSLCYTKKFFVVFQFQFFSSKSQWAEIVKSLDKSN